MRLVGIKSLKPGDELARPVYTSSGKVILNSGIVLTETFISKFKQIGINKVYITDSRFGDVEVTHPIDITTRNNVVKVLKEVHQKIHSSKGIDEYPIKDSAKKIVDYVREYKGKGVSMLSMEAVDEYVIEHSVNVAIITAFLGNKMSYNLTQLCDLVAGALIHDLGRGNQSEEKPEHVQLGFEVMRKLRGLSLHSSIVCYEHHENYDGSGYPRKLKGTAISEYSRIVRAADYYDNALHGSYSNGFPIMPHQAFEVILAAAGQILDPDIVQMFRDTIVFYPDGCTIQLSNGLQGVVIRQNLGSPQRPVVRIYNDSEVIGDIDLLKSLTLFIQDVIVI